MSLADRAGTTIALQPAFLTCHMATWHWAAEEATALGRLAPQTLLMRAGNIGTIAGPWGLGPEGAIKSLPRQGTWDFRRQGMPGPGTVMLWLTGSSHSAVSTPDGITGYNQSCIFPFMTDRGHTTGLPGQLTGANRTCHLISAETMINAAVANAL